MKKMDTRMGGDPSTLGHMEQFYAWWGKNTEMWLSYSKDRHQGTLTMNSRRIREEGRDYEKEKGKKKGSRKEDSKCEDHPSFQKFRFHGHFTSLLDLMGKSI
jgi:hypothetical protein